MPHFYGIAPGEEKTAPGIRVRISDDGERVWMHGKWLDIPDNNAIAWVSRKYEFRRPDGRKLKIGQFPGWVVRSTKRSGPLAIMFDASQFAGGNISV